MAWKCLQRGQQSASKADYVSDSTSETHSLHLLVPRTPALSGPILAGSVAVGESSVGPAVTTAVTKATLGGLYQILRHQEYPEQPRLSCIAPSPAVPEADCVQVPNTDAAARVAAALQALPEHSYSSATGLDPAKNRPTILDYHHSYKAGVVTPSVVAERVIKFLEAHNAKQHWLSAWSAQHIREAAAAATERYAAGKPLSVLDGVPFVVKDCIDALPYETSFGTRFMGKLHPVKADAPCVAALKELGAVLLGKGAMVEFGCLATGFNTHSGSTLNPHNGSKMSGGSSSGSAAAVAAGLAPIAIGTDGGGSIRVPSSWCGVMGLKTTKGRLADDHGAHSCFSSVTVSGPIATTAADLMLLYAAMANVDYPTRLNPSSNTSSSNSSTPDNSPSSSGNGQRTARSGDGVAAAAAAAVSAPDLQPLSLPCQLLPCNGQAAAAAWQPLSGLRVGIYDEWYAMSSPGVLAAVDKAVQALVDLGATRVAVTLPDLDLMQAAHSAVFAGEYYYDAAQAGWRDDWKLRQQLNLDSRMFYCNAGLFAAADYTTALRICARAFGHFEHAFGLCDVIVTPATPMTAPDLPAAVHSQGVYDVAQTFETIRFTQAANLTGLPAVVVPAGRVQEDGLPVGIQIMGRHYAEATLLKVAAALEQRVDIPVPELALSAQLLQPLASTDDTSPVKDQLPCSAGQAAASKRDVLTSAAGKGYGQRRSQGVLKLLQLLQPKGSRRSKVVCLEGTAHLQQKAVA